MKNLIYALFCAVILVGCTKDSDPTPATNQPKTSLEQVKATLVGTWTFQSVTVTQASKTAKTSTCAKSELASTGFADQNWKDITPEPNLIYVGSNNVGYNLPCLTGNPTDNLTWSCVENSDKTVTIMLSNGRTFIIDINDITPTVIKASLVNDKGYNVKFEFKK